MSYDRFSNPIGAALTGVNALFGKQALRHRLTDGARFDGKRVLFTALAFALGGCNGIETLDEAVLYQTPEFTIKLVRYYESLFLHFNGEVFSIQCRSAKTSQFRAAKRQKAGWRTITTGAAIGSTSAAEVAAAYKDRFVIMGTNVVAYIDGGVSVSFDACGVFNYWGPTQLPLELINQIEKPSWCAPQGTGDCRHFDFQNDRAPAIEALQIDPSGHITFLARSKAFVAPDGYRIESNDFGRTWTFTE